METIRKDIIDILMNENIGRKQKYHEIMEIIKLYFHGLSLLSPQEKNKNIHKIFQELKKYDNNSNILKILWYTYLYQIYDIDYLNQLFDGYGYLSETFNCIDFEEEIDIFLTVITQKKQKEEDYYSIRNTMIKEFFLANILPLTFQNMPTGFKWTEKIEKYYSFDISFVKLNNLYMQYIILSVNFSLLEVIKEFLFIKEYKYFDVKELYGVIFILKKIVMYSLEYLIYELKDYPLIRNCCLGKLYKKEDILSYLDKYLNQYEILYTYPNKNTDCFQER